MKTETKMITIKLNKKFAIFIMVMVLILVSIVGVLNNKKEMCKDFDVISTTYDIIWEWEDFSCKIDHPRLEKISIGEYADYIDLLNWE